MRAGGYELDLVVRRGRRLVVVEVKEKSGAGFGDPLEMVGTEKVRRVLPQREHGSPRDPELAGLELVFEAVGVTGRRVERVPLI